ncbi:hypothetical protein [Clostridium hydrogeniformans]|uniref:hypothetical protein n=1 Tax=Clostridium hydrogeniformans TaxID=349933 RepID=UPI000489C6A7|nr:hypothetical protein [Clostridium hydrogeniformans]
MKKRAIFIGGFLVIIVIIASYIFVGEKEERKTSIKNENIVSDNRENRDNENIKEDKKEEEKLEGKDDEDNKKELNSKPVEESKSLPKTNSDKKSNENTVSNKVSNEKVKENIKKEVKPEENKAAGPKEYVSKALGFSITFPASWVNHYRVEESKDGIMVFFKPKDKPLTYKGEGWLFLITKKTEDNEEEHYDGVGSPKTFEAKGITYLTGGPTDFPFLEDHPELNKFREMMSERSKVISTIKVLK